MTALTASPLAIDLQAVAKTYRGRVHALRDVSMRVHRGEVFGLLGPNGAGKSTLVKIMLGIVRPSGASGSILDHHIGHKPTLRRIGYLPENHRFPRYLSGRQVLEFFAAMSQVDRPTRKQRAGQLLECIGMSAWSKRRISAYSKGMMQRIGIAQAMMNDPDLLVLDEPTDGVDPVGRRDIRDLLLELKEQGKTIFINSHLLSELEMVCDRLAILAGGKVVQQGTIDELSAHRQRYELEVIGADPAALHARLRAAVPGAAWQNGAATLGTPIVLRGKLPGGQFVEIDGPILRLGIVDPVAVQPMVDALRSAGLGLKRMQLVRPSLEDLFLEAVGGAAGGHNVGAA